MFFRPSSRLSTSLLGAGIALSLLASGQAQDPAKPPGDAPVRKELDAFREKSTKNAPADRIKAYEQGIEEVRKTGVVEKALKVGDKAPDFELPNASGKVIKLSELTAKGPVVLTWYRGGWCPYCNISLRGFHTALPEIQAAGANLVALSPELPDNTMSTAEKNHLDFEVLSDRGNKVAHAFGVAYKLPKVVSDQFKGRLDLAKFNGDDSAELPLGATYIVDKEGVIRYAFVDHDYRKRAEPSEVVAALKKISEKPGS